MAVHHTAQIPRLIKETFYNYLSTQLTDSGMTTGTNTEVKVFDAFPSWTDDENTYMPSLVISHHGWQPVPYELGGGDYLEYPCTIAVLAQNKNQREDLAYHLEGWLRNKSTTLIDYNVSSSTRAGKIYFRDTSVTAPFVPMIGKLPEEYDYLLEVSVTLRVFVD